MLIIHSKFSFYATLLLTSITRTKSEKESYVQPRRGKLEITENSTYLKFIITNTEHPEKASWTAFFKAMCWSGSCCFYSFQTSETPDRSFTYASPCRFPSTWLFRYFDQTIAENWAAALSRSGLPYSWFFFQITAAKSLCLQMKAVTYQEWAFQYNLVIREQQYICQKKMHIANWNLWHW